MNGFISLDYCILDWEWYRDANTMRLFLHCLLKANWKDGRFQGYEIPRGSFVTSISHLANELCMTEKEVRTALKHLTETGELGKQSNSKFSVITVNNYCLYQDPDRRTANQGQTKARL